MDRRVQKHSFRRLTSWFAEPAVDHDLQIGDVCGCRCWRQVGRYLGAKGCHFDEFSSLLQWSESGCCCCYRCWFLWYSAVRIGNLLRATLPSAKRVLAIVILSVRLSVCLSVTTQYRSKPKWDGDSGFLPLIVSSFCVTKFRSAVWGFPRTRVLKTGTPLNSRYFTTISSSSVRTVAGRQTCCLL